MRRLSFINSVKLNGCQLCDACVQHKATRRLDSEQSRERFDMLRRTNDPTTCCSSISKHQYATPKLQYSLYKWIYYTNDCPTENFPKKISSRKIQLFIRSQRTLQAHVKLLQLPPINCIASISAMRIFTHRIPPTPTKPTSINSLNFSSSLVAFLTVLNRPARTSFHINCRKSPTSLHPHTHR